MAQNRDMTIPADGVPVPATKAASNVAQSLRDQLRAKVLGRQRRRIPLDLIAEDGSKIQVEILEPDVDSTLQRDGNSDITPKERMIQQVIEYTFVPGTDERVFEEADVAVIGSLPFGQEFSKIFGKIMELQNLREAMAEARKPSSATPPNS